MDTIAALRSAGLSEREALTYLDLLQNGESQTGKICDRTKIPSSQIYSILNTLLEKGLVSYKIINNIKVFNAAKPNSLANLFEERERRIKNEKVNLLKFIKKLEKSQPKPERLTDFKYFHGILGIKSLYTEIINSWERGDEYFIVSAPLESFKKLEAFFLEIVHKKRVKDKVKLRIIINKNSKKYGLARTKLPLTQVKYLDIDTKTEYGVLNDYFFLVNYGSDPYGLLIKDKNFSETYSVYFDLLWQIAKS